MKTQQHCLYCGSPAEEVSSNPRTMDLTEFTFRCTDKKCNGTFTGVLTLTRTGTPGAQNFRGQRPPEKAGEVVTDC